MNDCISGADLDLAEVTRRMAEDYYLLDNSAFFECLDDDCVWVLPNHMVCRGKQEARAMFEQGWVMPPFDMYDAHFEVIPGIPSGVAVVTGRYHLLSSRESEHVMAMSQYMSAVWREDKQGWRIKYLHVSAEWSETAPNEVYPVKTSKQTWRYVQAMIGRGGRDAIAPLTLRTVDGGLAKIDPVEVLSIRAQGKRCVLNTVGGERSVASSLAELEEKLPDPFVRVHRSHIVNRAHVSALDATGITLVDGSRIPVPAKRAAAVRRLLE